jgi:Flp pilus assembly protein TadG
MNSTRERRGNVVLETALVLPVLLMLAMGAAEYGYFFYVKATLQGAARSGARAAIVPGATNANVDSAIASAMSTSGFAGGSYSANYTSVGVSAGNDITVTMTANWGSIGIHPLPTALGGISTSKQVRAAATMRKE